MAKLGGNPRISIFLRGDESLTDSLIAIGQGGRKLEKGLRERVREAYGGKFEADIVGEPSGPAGILLDWQAPDPGRQSPADPDGGCFPGLAGATRLFQQTPDVVVFSVEPDVCRPVWRQKSTGLRVCPPPGWERDWSPDQRRLFAELHELEGLVPVEQFRREFSRLVAGIKARLAAHVIVFNCFAFDPRERTRNYAGVPDTIALRALKFNLALIDISTDEGISIVDIDRLLTEVGGESHVAEVFDYSPRACELIRDEFLRVLQDIGFFESRPLIMQVGKKKD